MEIRFIWIEEYRQIIENLNVNFQHLGNHQFSYKDGNLEILPNTASVLSFGEKIKGITAIAGKNGSGKSSICEIVLNAAATYVNGGWGWNMHFKGIVCYGTRIFYSKHLKLANKAALENAGYEVKEFDESPFEKIPVDWRLEFHKGSFIYYSNVLDWRSGMDLTNLTNISTQYLISNDYRTGTAMVPDFRDQDKTPNVLNTYYNGQAYRNTKFYLDFSNQIPFDPPKYFILKGAHSGINRYINYKRIFSYDDYRRFDELEIQILRDIQNFPENVERGQLVATNKQQAREAIMDLYRFNLLMIFDGVEPILPDYERAAAFVRGFTEDYELFSNPESARRLIQIHEELVALGDIGDEYSPQYLMDNNKYSAVKFPIIENLYINNTEQGRALLQEFLILEEAFLRGENHYNKRISNYAIHPFPSAGESSYYTFFSRLYDAIKRYDIGYDDREDLVLFIDEGEVGFHPAWKKKFLKWIVDFLNQDFNKYKFQIILTTHSPYLLSDLTSEHILLLKRNGATTEIVPSENFQTFGANINDLLADAFFLTDGQIGEFAKEKIQGVIDQLNEWRQLKVNIPEGQRLTVEQNLKENCRNIIGLIGDNIVRRKLFEMYSELFDDDAILDNEIDFLENRLRQLKERKEK